MSTTQKPVSIPAPANANKARPSPFTASPKTYRLVSTSGSCFNAATTDIVRR